MNCFSCFSFNENKTSNNKKKRKETSTSVHPHRENLSPEQAQPFSKTKTQHKPHSQPPQRTHPGTDSEFKFDCSIYIKCLYSSH